MAKARYKEWLEPDGLLKLEAWARDGLTDAQIAHNMGVTAASLYNYKKDHIEIFDALKRGKAVVDIQVENALLKRAMGYSYEETKIEESEKDGRKEVKMMKYMPGDTTAQIFWLKNRKPEEWRDKKDIDANVNMIPKVTLMKADDVNE